MHDLADGNQTSPGDFPKRGLRKEFVPKVPPPINGPPINIEEFRQLPDTSRLGALAHGGDQDDDGTEIDLATEKSHGGGCHPLPATITSTAETQAVAVFLGKITRATGFAGIIGAVQMATA